jgi:LCP family protein required for cell wall assembly
MRIVSSLRRSPIVAAALSFLFPGLGQAYAGAWRRGLLFALPILAIAVVGAVAGAITLGAISATGALGILVQPEVLAGLLGFNVLLFAWRCLAVVDAYRVARTRHAAEPGLAPEPVRSSPPRPRTRAAALAIIAGLVVVMAASHAVVGYFGYEAYDTMVTVFEPSEGEDAQTAAGEDPYGTPEPDEALGAADQSPSLTQSPPPTPSPSVVATPSSSATQTLAPSPSPSTTLVPSPSPSPTPVPSPTQTPRPDWASDGRLDVLIVGGDAGPDRWSLRTDTMILVSVDVKTGRAAMFGIPRNLYNVPLPSRLARLFPNGTFPQMINALYVYADQRPALFPGGKSRGYLALGAAIEALTGVDLDGIAVADLRGFVKLVDALGGLNITIRRSLYDSHYPLEDGSGWIEVYFKPGKYHFNGRMALAYARSRHQDSDYGRMHRQQEVLMALRNQVKPICLVSRVGELAKIAKSSLWTNIPVKSLPGLLELASRVDTRTIKRVYFNPPTYRMILQKDDVQRIRKVVRDAFKGPAPKPDPAIPAPADDSGC